MTIPTQAQVDRLFQEYTNSAIRGELTDEEIAKKKSVYQNAYTRLQNFKLKGGARERIKN